MSLMTVNSSTRSNFAARNQKSNNPADGLDWVIQASEWVGTLFDANPTPDVHDDDDDGENESMKSDDDDENQASNQKIRAVSSLEKAVVLQEARIFHDDKAVKNQPECILQVLAKLLRLESMTGVNFSRNEATELFFATTKLFLSDDEFVRRLVYLFLKEIYSLCDANDIIIITSSLMKDMTCEIDQYRANALRVLARIIDPGMLSAIERYVKQAIVDTYGPSSSAGLLAGIKLSQTSSECAVMIRKWITETHQAIKSHDGMQQYLALLLLYQMKSADRLAVSKIVSQYQKKGSLRCPLAIVMLIRYTMTLITEEIAIHPGIKLTDSFGAIQEGINYLLICLKHPSDMVAYEATRALSALPLTAEELKPVVYVLDRFLSSSKPCVRFAALKTLSSITESFPALTVRCNDNLESLTEDENFTIVSMALTTLLRSSTEDSIYSVLERISKNVDEMESEDRVSIVKSIISLDIKYPSRHQTLLVFLERFLMRRAPYDFKKAIVMGIVQWINDRPETGENSLLVLSKSLDACEHAVLITETLHAIAELSRLINDASPLIPHVYNCFLLGDRCVRAATVSSLAKIASHQPHIRTSVVILLKNCLRDDDDETRDRAATALKILTVAIAEEEENICSDVSQADEVDQFQKKKPSEDDIALQIHSPLSFSFNKLERSIQAYMLDHEVMNSEDLLTFESLPPVDDVVEDEQSTDNIAALIRKRKVDPTDSVYAIPELAALGKIFRSSPSVHLTESETEYVVECVKHIYSDNKVVLEFKVKNTVENQRLSMVGVAITGYNGENIYDAIGELKAPRISYSCTESCFIVLESEESVISAFAGPSAFSLELQFMTCAIDEETNEEIGESLEEEYCLEDLEIISGDFMVKNPVGDFKSSWNKMGKANEVYKKIGLQFGSLQEAFFSITNFLGMHVCDGTDHLNEGNLTLQKMLHLSGTLIGGHSILARALIFSPQNNICVLKLLVRSESKDISQTVIDWIK